MREKAKVLSRRSLFFFAVSGIAALVGSGRTQKAFAQEKGSKEKAEYQDTPKDIRMCATCSLFVAP